MPKGVVEFSQLDSSQPMSDLSAVELGMFTSAAGISSGAVLSVLLAVVSPNLVSPQQAETLRVSVSLVTVGVRVVDAKKREVPGLGVDDFRIYEDSVAQQIALFSNEEQPISLAILLDRSDSMEMTDKFLRAKNAAEHLVDACHAESEFLYIPFDAGWPEPEFSQDRNQIRRAIAGTKLGSGTRLYDAVQAALERCRHAQRGRQAMIVITDGNDQHSRSTLNDLIHALKKSRVQLFGIGYFSTATGELYRISSPKGITVTEQPIGNLRTAFKRLARESGGEAFFPRSDQELQMAVEQISKDLRTQYTLSYYPSNATPDDRYRRIKVKLRRRGLRVRARQGYILGKTPFLDGPSENSSLPRRLGTWK
jgi:Ca-activated chloride channel family protein